MTKPTDMAALDLCLSDEVQLALASRQPVVALESSIIAQGMPYPKNIELALRLQGQLRELKVTPATTAILDGRLCVGLSDAQIERLGTEKGVLKVSRRDLGYALAIGASGATTVATTMWMAHRAGIAVFATGGIGGVHRGAEHSFDISADLLECAQTSVCVITAGAKAILDLPKTLELLETLGVPVVGYRTSDFPAFYSRESGLALSMRAESPEAIARMFTTQRALGLPMGMLVANPIPAAFEIPRDVMEAHIARAVADMEAAGIKGKLVTPYLLGRIATLTSERSLSANICLVENNVAVAAEIAQAVCRIVS